VPSGEPLLKLFTAKLNKPVRAMALFQTVSRILGDDSTHHVKASRGGTKEIADRFPLRILLADDNGVNQRVAALSLARLGYRADLANNGVEALAAFQSLNHDVILMDVRMPEMDGIEATRKIRTLFSPYQPWIIGLSAGATKEEHMNAIQAGMNDFIAKPFRMETLAACLERAHHAIHTPTGTKAESTN